IIPYAFELYQLNDLEENTSLLIFPNPTTGILNIKHRASVTYIKLIDRVGSLIIQKLCSGAQTTQIDMSQLANGIYYIKADGYAPMKVIKKK
ncbi:MAG TPA: T9SS type A sorting domain-containing protein, partial [Chitinophagaceae bacterium]|nr:T9SS type A sorting domain-containing protein [Chitinophagaceae bacterium]